MSKCCLQSTRRWEVGLLSPWVVPCVLVWVHLCAASSLATMSCSSLVPFSTGIHQGLCRAMNLESNTHPSLVNFVSQPPTSPSFSKISSRPFSIVTSSTPSATHVISCTFQSYLKQLLALVLARFPPSCQEESKQPLPVLLEKFNCQVVIYSGRGTKMLNEINCWQCEKKGRGRKKPQTLTKSGLCWLQAAATLKGLQTTNSEMRTTKPCPH